MEREVNKLLRKYFTGTISEEEKRQLNEWRAESDNNRQTLEALENLWRESSEEPELVNTEEMIDKIWRQGVERKPPRKKQMDWNYLLRIAAVLLIFISAVWGITKLDNAPTRPIERTVVKNTAGQKKLNLPDGTVVWLNGATKIHYYPGFNDTARHVELEGEAFFEVAHDPDRPFVVKTETLATTAIGTSFNINAYSQQEEIQVSLLTGKVEVSDGSPAIVLEPGRALIYEKDSKNMSETTFDEEETIGWKEGWLVFRNAGYEEVIMKLQNWYGMEITTQGDPSGAWRLTTAYKNESLSNILKNIRFGKPFNYELNNERLIIKFE